MSQDHHSHADAVTAHWLQPRTPRTPVVASAVRAEHLRRAVRDEVDQLAQCRTRPNGDRPRNSRWRRLDWSR